MATTRSLLSERRSTLFLSLTFLLLSLIVIIFFATDASNRLSSFYFTSSTDLVSSHSISPSPPFHLVLTSAPNSRINVSHIGDETPELDKIKGENGADEDGREDTKYFAPRWEICRKEKGLEVVDIIPCLDNMKAIKALKSRRRMEHRERHCPNPSPRCLVPLPLGYKIPVPWPKSRDMIWYSNVPHPKLVKYKKDQNWVTKSGEFFDFPGGGTQFKGGVNSYIQFIEQTLPAIEWGRHTRVVLDVGCGVASFGGYLLDKDVITLSLAPKDEHEAQIQFALERGIPAILSVIGTQQLTFPDGAFDLIHCARCRVHWDGDGGKPLMELNRVLRPGGLFVWSATPVYRDDPKDQSVWNAMVSLTESICWKQIVKASDVNGIGVVIYQKPTTNTCYEERKVNNPPVCIQKNRLNISWYTPLEGCLPLIHSANSDTQHTWPISWPERLIKWTSNLFETNSEYFEKRYHEDMMHWETIVSDVYMHKLEIRWSAIRNVLDMNAVFGGFAAVLVKEPVWVMNVVPIHELDTLPVIFNRGLIGTYHDWCESFNTYPRTYDLIHSSFLFGNLTKRCECVSVVVEMDRILRPGGWVLIHDTVDMIKILSSILHSLHWDTSIHEENFLIGKKGFWRPS